MQLSVRLYWEAIPKRESGGSGFAYRVERRLETLSTGLSGVGEWEAAVAATEKPFAEIKVPPGAIGASGKNVC